MKSRRYDDSSITFIFVSSCGNIVVVMRSLANSRLSKTLLISVHFRQLLHFLVAYCVVYQRPSGWKGRECGVGDNAVGSGGHGLTSDDVGQSAMLNDVVCVVRDRHCGGGKLVSVGLYQLRHM